MNKNQKTVRQLVLLFCKTLVLGCWSVAHASSVIEVSIEEMIQRAELVFEGEVIAVDVYDLGDRGVQTRVTFEIIDIIKGEHEGDELVLGFLGGRLSDRQLIVTEMHVPKAGERGIYFAESPGRNLVHPLYGWSQGHLILQTDADGTDRVMTQAGRPVNAMKIETANRTVHLSSGVARGLLIYNSESAFDAMSKREFKLQLRDMLK